MTRYWILLVGTPSYGRVGPGSTSTLKQVTTCFLVYVMLLVFCYVESDVLMGSAAAAKSSRGEGISCKRQRRDGRQQE
jgi:hypothetical protein